MSRKLRTYTLRRASILFCIVIVRACVRACVGVCVRAPISTCNVLNNIISLVVEAEYGSYFHNDQKAATMRVTLHEMVHPKPVIPIQVYNSCAAVIANNEIKPYYKWLRNFSYKIL